MFGVADYAGCCFAWFSCLVCICLFGLCFNCLCFAGLIHFVVYFCLLLRGSGFVVCALLGYDLFELLVLFV